MDVKEKIIESKKQHRLKEEEAFKQIRDHIDKYGSKPCDWLIHRQSIFHYNAGAWNALHELERSL